MYMGVAPSSKLINVKIMDSAQGINLTLLEQAMSDVLEEHKDNKARAQANPQSWDFRGSVVHLYVPLRYLHPSYHQTDRISRGFSLNSSGWEAENALTKMAVMFELHGISIVAGAGDGGGDVDGESSLIGVDAKNVFPW